MRPDETQDDPDSATTSRVPSLRDHLDEAEFLEFSNNLLGEKERAQVVAHLDACSRCREVLAELSRDQDEGSTKRVHTLLGSMLGEYRVESTLSRGGMGAVYQGVHPVIGKQVAIKVLLPDAAGDPDRMHRLLVEARAVNAIHHPNIIDIFSFGELPDGRQYFVMELLKGKTLEELVDEKHALSTEETLTVLEQVASALSAAHGAGVIHRDLKPANLFVSTLPNQSWHVTVLDFGLAKQLNSTSAATRPDIVMGTPGYMAPEQIRGEKVSERTDLYALGVMGWILLAGETPFGAARSVELMWKHLEDPFPSLTQKVPGCPHALVRLIEKMVEKNPEARPRSATEVLTEVQRIRKEVESYKSLKTPSPVIPAEQLIKPENRAIAATVPAGHAAVGATREEKETRVFRKPNSSQQAETKASPGRAAATHGGLKIGVAVGVVVLVSIAGWRMSSPTEVPPPTPVIATPPPVEAVVKAPVAVEPAAPEPEVAEPEAAEPEAPVAEPAKPSQPANPAKPPKPKSVSTASLGKRITQARAQAAKLDSAAARRMMTLDLDRLEDRIQAGENPRTVNRDLDEVLDKYQ